MMKSFAALLFLAIGSVATAFPVPGYVQVTPNNVSVQFCNNVCNYVLTCQAQATGILQTGAPVNSGGTMYLPPGQCAYAYVYATYPYYFVNGQGYANCY